MFSLLRRSLGSPVRRSRESAFAMLPLVHKQAIPSRCGVGYTAPFEEAKRILPDPRSDHGAAVHADRHLLNFAGLLFRNDRRVIDLQTGVRFLTTESASNIYASHDQGLLLPRFILFIRDIIRSCLDKYGRGIFTASFDSVKYDGFSHYLEDGTDPIFPEGGIGTSGGLYVLLEGVLGFNDQHPRLAILFFGELMKVNSYDALHRLLDDLYVKGVISRVRSMGQLYQVVSNFAPYGSFYKNAHDADITDWKTAISRVSADTFYDVKVETLIENIPVKHVRDALIDFRKRTPESYVRPDISSCIEFMRHANEHCNQKGGPKRRVSKPLTVKEALWGLNYAFHVVYPFSQSFLNENRYFAALDPTYFSGSWEEIK